MNRIPLPAVVKLWLPVCLVCPFPSAHSRQGLLIPGWVRPAVFFKELMPPNGTVLQILRSQLSHEMVPRFWHPKQAWLRSLYYYHSVAYILRGAWQRPNWIESESVSPFLDCCSAPQDLSHLGHPPLHPLLPTPTPSILSCWGPEAPSSGLWNINCEKPPSPHHQFFLTTNAFIASKTGF